MPGREATPAAAPPAADPQPPAPPSAAAEPTKRKRAPVKRLTADEKRAKVTSAVEDNLNAAGKLVVLAAEGLVNRRDRERARRCLEVWDTLISIALPEEPEEPEAPAAPA